MVEHYADGYAACPLGLKGVIVGEGDTCAEASQNIESAIRFHVETAGEKILDPDPESPILETFVAEASLHL